MEAITERVKKVMEDHGLSGAQMAEKIGVQPSAISHILSGRNKPSLDFILKVLNAFSNVSSDWLLKGDKAAQNAAQISAKNQLSKSAKNPPQKTVEKVMVFYTDKTVEEYLLR